MVQHGGAPDFNHDEREAEEVWKAQYKVGSQIQAALDRTFQLHKTMDFQISSISAPPRDLSVSIPCIFCSHPPSAAAEAKLMRQEHRASPAVLQGAMARAVEHQSDHAVGRDQHLGV